MVVAEAAPSFRLSLAVLLAGMIPLVLFGSGCSTDVVPTAPEPETRDLPIRGKVSGERLMKVYSRDFNEVYTREGPWTSYMLVYLSVQFMARDGLSEFQKLSREKQETYPGIRRFVDNVEKGGGPWSYIATRALETMKQENKRESFRSKLNFAPYQNFAIGKWIKNRLSSEQPLPDFDAIEVDNEFQQPIVKSMALILAAQYYLRSYQNVTEPTVMDADYHQDMSWLISEWNENYLRVRSIWKPRFDLSQLSSDSLSPLYEPARQHPTDEFWDLNPADRSYGRTTLPFREIYDVSMENITPRIRDLQTKAIQEFIENRLHSSLIRWLKSVTYAIKFRFFEEITNREHTDRSDVKFYARNALQDINNVIEMN